MENKNIYFVVYKSNPEDLSYKLKIIDDDIEACQFVKEKAVVSMFPDFKPIDSCDIFLYQSTPK